MKILVCKHCSDEAAVFDNIKHLRTHIRRIHKQIKQQNGEWAAANVSDITQQDSLEFERYAIELATQLPIAAVPVSIEGNVEFQQTCLNDPKTTCYPMVEFELDSAIDDTVLTGSTSHEQFSSNTVCHQLDSTKTLDQLIDQAIARDHQNGVTLEGQLIGMNISRRLSSSICMVVQSTNQRSNCMKSTKNTKRNQQKAKFDSRRRAALRCNGQIISAVVAKLHSMVSSGSAILNCSDDQAIEELRHMDKRPRREQMPKEVYLTMLITARQFVPAEPAPVTHVESTEGDIAPKPILDSPNNDVSTCSEVREMEPEAIQATSEFYADLQNEPDEDKAEWVADIYKSYGSCLTQFPESDGSSSLDGLNLTSDVEGDILPCPRRRPNTPTKKKTVNRRYLDSRRVGSGVMTRCWTTNSLRRVRPDDMKITSPPRGRRNVERAAREFRKCFAPFQPRRRKAVESNAVKRPNLRSVVTVPSQGSSS